MNRPGTVMLSVLQQFAGAIQQKFSSHVSGEPEDQLRAPFEQLLVAVGKQTGLDVLAIGETLLANGGGKPDFGVSVNQLLCGYAELKAPGKGADITDFTGHDKAQWERFKNLPNILYSDGREFAVHRKLTDGRIAVLYATAASIRFDPFSTCVIEVIRSMGSGNTMVVFCSAPISTRVCR